MTTVFSDILYTQLLVYFDDLIIHSNGFPEHLERLRNVFAGLQFYNLKVKPRKCRFAAERTQYLGHVISAKGIEQDPANVEKVVQQPVPKTVKQVRAFIALASYYRRFVKDFAEIAKPLHNLIKKDSRFKWTPEHQQTFDALKQALTSPPVLAFPDYDKPFILHTDASDHSIGAILSQDFREWRSTCRIRE